MQTTRFLPALFLALLTHSTLLPAATTDDQFGVAIDRSNAPADLAGIFGAYDTHVIPPAQYDEYTFSAFALRFPDQAGTAREGYGFGFEILNDELRALKPLIDQGLSLSNIQVRQVFAGEAQTPSAQIFETLGHMNFLPYYCNKIRGVEGAEESEATRRCVEVTRQIIAPADEEERTVYLVTIEGQYWGTYQWAKLYVSSKSAPNVFVRLDFDILHEI